MQKTLFPGPVPYTCGGVSQYVLGLCLRTGCAHTAWAGGWSRSDSLGAGNLCLPLRQNASGRWTLPLMSPEDVLFALPAEDYSDLSFATEQPPDYVSYEVPETGAEPHARLLVAARREISMWAASADDLGAALTSLWPELQRGFALMPGRSGQREALPNWDPSLLAIPDVSSRSPSRRVSPAPFFSSDEVPFVGL